MYVWVGTRILQLMVNFQFFPYFNSETYLQHRPNTGEGESHVKYSALQNDSGIGETPLAEHLKRQTKFSKKKSRKQLPLQIFSTPITPRSERSKPMEQDVEYSADTESDEESLLSHGSQKQIVDRGQFAKWSRSGPSNVSGSPVSGRLRGEHSERCYKEPLRVSEAHLQSYRDQHICKPRKLSYEDKPYNQQKPEEGMSDEEVIRREVQELINLAGSKTLQAVRRKHRMIRSFFQRTSDMMLSSIDSFQDETQTTSYGALEKYKRQFSEQVQGLRKQMEKTSLIVDGMEVTFVSFFNIIYFPFSLG
ncbi:uncharacterized protein LOC110054553 [Orbicella faveolata]|uniref:uncharacterized protein LOC110054553 n=1 Tax=Orbicella faveolata TaxID=48498 RepID=UPI0009E252DA|nr:uncharacterized protein LOC110054553 [Orbicella faveolata]